MGVGRVCECTGVNEVCVAHVLIFGNLTLYLGSVTYVIVMISLLTVTFLSNV